MVSISNIDNYSKVSLKNISFSGHNLCENDNGEKTYKFFIPKVSYDNAKVILKKFRLNSNEELEPVSYFEPIEREIPKDTSCIEINPKDIGLSSTEVLGYRFVIDKKEYLDKHRTVTIGDTTYNIADSITTDVLQTPKSIYHLIPGTFNPKLRTRTLTNACGKTVVDDEATAKMNHFMKYDTSLNDIIAKIQYIKDLGFRRVLSTPIFGQDNISNAGYWTTNPFQITERLGSISDFEKLQIELFKKSMGHIADGAFTSEGLMGIHFRDILRRGEKSPFTKWFEINGKPALGVLPDNAEAYENFDIRVINSPIQWTVDEYGLPTKDFGKTNDYYDSTKETLIQIYDRRLTSKEQLAKDKPFYSYDIKNTPNRDKISSWTDSVYPYTFPVHLDELARKTDIINKNRDIPAKEFLQEWENFKLVKAKDSENVRLWTGNKDMVKLRFTVPAYKKAQMTSDELQEAVTSAKDVQDYVVSIGKFWTNRTAKTLREYIAKQIAAGRNAREFQRIIIAKAGTDLPAEMKYITEQQISKALKGEYQAINTLKTPLSLASALKEYPMEALEVADDLASILAYPSIKKEINEKFFGTFQECAIEILQRLDRNNLPCGNLLNDGSIAPGKAKIVQLIADDIMRFILLKSLNKNLSTNDIFANDKEGLAKLKNITAADICTQTKNLDFVKAQLIKTMEKNLNSIEPDDIVKLTSRLKAKLGNITPESLKVADLIIDKAEAGLNWRIDAAKDIADIEAYEEGRADIQETWGEVKDFWHKFNEGVRLFNKHSYKIAEVTNSSVASTESNPKISNAGQLESKMIEHGGFTSQSNYNYLFDTLQRFFTAQPEFNAPFNSNALDLICNKFDRGWNGVPGYLYSGSKNNIAYSHAAVGNHDKQRISHTFAFNMLLAYLPEETFVNRYRGDDFWKKVANEIKDDLLMSSMEKSIYYDQINENNFRRVFHSISPRNLAKVAALNDAFSDATRNHPNGDELRETFSKTLDTLAAKRTKGSEHFFCKNFEANYEDIVNASPQEFREELRKLKGAIHKRLTRPARLRGVELAKLMVAMPGNPTLYAGDELLELGGEEKGKNVTLQNRNRLHWEYAGQAGFAHIKEYSDTLAKIYALRNDENLSCLVNGDTLLLPRQAEKCNREVMGMYRYNEHDDCIILMHNIGFNSSRNYDNDLTIPINSIDLSATDIEYYPDGWTDKGGIAKAGLPKPLVTGSEFVDALDSSKKFIIKEDGKLYNAESNSIVLTNPVTILKRVK